MASEDELGAGDGAGVFVEGRMDLFRAETVLARPVEVVLLTAEGDTVDDVVSVCRCVYVCVKVHMCVGVCV